MRFPLAPGRALSGLWERGGKSGQTAIGPDDLVMVTNGSMTANSTLSSTDTAPALDTTSSSGSWQPWETFAAKRPGLGDPKVFDSSAEDSTWEPHFREQPEEAAWARTAGSSKRPSHFCAGSADCVSAGKSAPTSTRPSSPSAAQSSAGGASESSADLSPQPEPATSASPSGVRR
ncbi:oleate hydratase [Streptomyces sp. E11-3]|uniref:oleate hydratase n=1 Tax=Streptomyces sp. E11-3 TaxID=3110112 RepID=UPI00397EC47E